MEPNPESRPGKTSHFFLLPNIYPSSPFGQFDEKAPLTTAASYPKVFLHQDLLIGPELIGGEGTTDVIHSAL